MRSSWQNTYVTVRLPGWRPSGITCGWARMQIYHVVHKSFQEHFHPLSCHEIQPWEDIEASSIEQWNYLSRNIRVCQIVRQSESTVLVYRAGYRSKTFIPIYSTASLQEWLTKLRNNSPDTRLSGRLDIFPKNSAEIRGSFLLAKTRFRTKATDRAGGERFSNSPKGHSRSRFPYLKTLTRRLVTPQQFSAPWPLCPSRLRVLRELKHNWRLGLRCHSTPLANLSLKLDRLEQIWQCSNSYIDSC